MTGIDIRVVILIHFYLILIKMCVFTRYISGVLDLPDNLLQEIKNIDAVHSRAV